jgi:hypothetical protein
MAIAFVQSNSAQEDTSDTSMAVTLAGVGAGNLIVLWAKYETDVNNDATVSASDGTSSFVARAVNHHNTLNDLHGVFLYLLVGNSGSRTYTVTWSEAVAFKWLHVREFSYTGTLSFDVDNVTAEGASGTNPASGTITTTGTDEVAIGGVSHYQATTFTSPLIGGSAAASLIGSGTSTGSFHRILTATMTNGAAAATTDTGLEWVSSIISFMTGAGGGTTLTPGVGSADYLGRSLTVVQAMSNDARIVFRRA